MYASDPDRGGRCVLSLEQLNAEAWRSRKLEQSFRSLRLGAHRSVRIKSLDDTEDREVTDGLISLGN
jgi:hypothetical protein